MNRSIFIGLLLISASLLCKFEVYSQINFQSNSQYKYLKGSQASELNDDWTHTEFDDSTWDIGNAPFRYGDGEGGTVLSDMQYNYSTLYLRSTFDASQINNLKQIHFYIDYDDGFVVWVNNLEVVRRNAPENLSYNAFAPDLHESGIPVHIVIDSSEIFLKEGLNTIAIQGFNFSLESSDFYFDMAINALPSLPETSIVNFSHEAGFYYSPFDLTLTASESDENILYTLDGSNPCTSPTAILGNNDVTLNIDPSLSNNRPETPAFIVRASISKDGFANSPSQTKTFLFIENVKNQEYPGGNWPTYNINEQHIDLEMDQDVVNHPFYVELIDDALLDIPSILISTDLDNLFDESTGIYVNAWGHGPEWERPCSVELLNPDGSQGFQTNAGLRIRGGWSRHPEFPKHSFRLFFRSQYGASKLNYPLFENEGVNEFDKIDLRTSQNYAWANWDGSHNTMVRDVFCRESQGAINQPYTRSRYYHLYLNGMYWGLFQTQERSEARYASDYLGGGKDDYDVIKVNTEDYLYEIEATDGSLETWENIWNLCYEGFSNNANYFSLQGKNQIGQPVKESQILVDIDNLIDYMINIFYTGNFDAPTSSFGNNQGPNNFYAIFNHDDKSKGFVFFIHDAEHSLMPGPTGPGIGLYENRVEPESMNVEEFKRFHPQWLHHKLTENHEYRIRFADRAFQHLKGKGIFTPGKSYERFNERVQDLQTAIIAESARWGDTHNENAYTKHNAWLPEISDVNNNYFPNRTNVVIYQLENAGLFSMIEPSILKLSGSEIHQGDYYIAGLEDVVFSNANDFGKIYYTLNGVDPRDIGGTISNYAINIQNGEEIQIFKSTIIKTRVRNGMSWSPLKTYNFFATNDDHSQLKVTELHYHPMDVISNGDTISGKSYEFIEFLNIGETALNLSGFKLESAVSYEFPDRTIIPPKGFFVVATKPKYFYNTYGMVVDANGEGFFSNSGEHVLLLDSLGSEVISFTYEDISPWPENADGNGYSLTANAKFPAGDPNNYNYWMTSSTKGGSPFKHDSLFTLNTFESISINKTIIVYPNPVKDVLHIVSENFKNETINLSIYNCYGALVHESQFSEMTDISFKSLNLGSGFYIISCEAKNLKIRKRIVYTP